MKSRMNNGRNELNIEMYRVIKQIFTFQIIIGTIILLSANSGFAQQSNEFPEFIPPPKIQLSKDEKTVLTSEKDGKKYTKLAIDLMETRLMKAEQLADSESFNDVLQELGGFHALMNDTLEYLNSNNTGNGKSLYNFKRFEMALRGFMPRIEVIRREVPERHEIYVVQLLKLVRSTRTEAVKPLFTDSLVSDNN